MTKTSKYFLETAMNASSVEWNYRNRLFYADVTKLLYKSSLNHNFVTRSILQEMTVLWLKPESQFFEYVLEFSPIF